MSTEKADPPKATASRRRFVGRAVTADDVAGTNNASVGKAATSAAAAAAAPTSVNAVPKEITEDAFLNAAIEALLPSNYSFEVHKSIWQIRKHGITRVALQMPEGLSMYACALADLMERFTEAEAVILADVTYGACCVDDYTATALGCDMLIHYGHSCLIPIDTTTIRCLYVFVEIQVDTSHLRDTVLLNFPACLPSTSAHQLKSRGPVSVGAKEHTGNPAVQIEADDEQHSGGVQHDSTDGDEEECHIVAVGTVQFLAAVHGLKADLESMSPFDTANGPGKALAKLAITDGSTDAAHEASTRSSQKRIRYTVTIPQIKPLSPGEILGCTAPRLADGQKKIDALLYIGDGRFHLESIMIANPQLNEVTYRYDPYEKKITREMYSHAEMQDLRRRGVLQAKKSLGNAGIVKPISQHLDREGPSSQLKDAARAWAIVLGTLGRQGSLSVLKSVTSHLPASRTFPLLLSELSPSKLSLLGDYVDVFVQTSCPRLSIDWGYAFDKPLLSPYEANVAFGNAKADWMIPVGVSSTLSSSPSHKAEQHPVTIPSEPERTVDDSDYPMDFYADHSLGNWTPRWHVGQKENERKARMAQRARDREQQKREAASLAPKMVPSAA